MIVNPPVSGMMRLRVPFHEFILGEKLSYWTKIFDLRKIFGTGLLDPKIWSGLGVSNPNSF